MAITEVIMNHFKKVFITGVFCFSSFSFSNTLYPSNEPQYQHLNQFITAVKLKCDEKDVDKISIEYAKPLNLLLLSDSFVSNNENKIKFKKLLTDSFVDNIQCGDPKKTISLSIKNSQLIKAFPYSSAQFKIIANNFLY